MKSPRLRVLFFAQALIGILVPLFYYWGQQSVLQRRHLPTALFILEWICIALNAILNRWIRRQMDEYAVAALNRAEARCFRAASVWMILCIGPALFTEGGGGWFIGWMLTLAYPLLMLLRAGLFAWYDTEGIG